MTIESTALSLANPLTAVSSLASPLVGLANSLGIGARDKNPGRLASNLQWYQAALAGDMWAYRQLSCMAGEQTYKSQQAPTAASCGWATQLAKDDAMRYLNDLRARGIGTTTGATSGNGFTLGTSPMAQGSGGVGNVIPLNQMGVAGALPSPAALGSSWVLLLISFAAVVYFRPKK